MPVEEIPNNRLALLLYGTGLLITLGTAAVTLQIKNEITAVRLEVSERLRQHESEAVRTYPSRLEFDTLRDQVNRLQWKGR